MVPPHPEIADPPPSTPPHEALLALLRGEPLRLDDDHASSAGVLAAALVEDVVPLLHARLAGDPDGCRLHPDVQARVVHIALGAAAVEVARQREVTSVLQHLADAGVRPVLFKGTPLAYTIYPEPSLRPRADTDLIVRPAEVDTAQRTLRALGYSEPPFCDDLHGQMPFERLDPSGVRHAVDVHWRVSAHPIFASIVSGDELDREAAAVPALGPSARAAAATHALLLACVHPAMHHRNATRVLWLLDIHLLASQLSPPGFDRFAALATSRSMAAVAAHSLAVTAATFGTVLPERILTALRSVEGEASAAYLQPDRRWRHETLDSLRHMASWRDRLHFLREIAFPSRHYMRARYDLGDRTTALLPLVYVHRLLRGGWRTLTGRK